MQYRQKCFVVSEIGKKRFEEKLEECLSKGYTIASNLSTTNRSGEAEIEFSILVSVMVDKNGKKVA